jgi:hypothetical protein
MSNSDRPGRFGEASGILPRQRCPLIPPFRRAVISTDTTHLSPAVDQVRRSRHLRTIRRAGTISIRSFGQSALCGMHILGTPLKHGP